MLKFGLAHLDPGISAPAAMWPQCQPPHFNSSPFFLKIGHTCKEREFLQDIPDLEHIKPIFLFCILDDFLQ